jgi:hypothetical protein
VELVAAEVHCVELGVGDLDLVWVAGWVEAGVDLESVAVGG